MSDSENDQLSPLERYLAKQKKTKAAKHEVPKPAVRGWAKAVAPAAGSQINGSTSTQPASQASSVVVDDSKAAEAGVPVGPSLSELARAKSTALSESLGAEPGEMFSRSIAFFIDWAIVTALAWPTQAILIAVFSVVSSGMVDFTAPALRFLSAYLVIFGYYGWFYSKKGASPGKLLMGLQVVDAADGTHLNFWKAFFREAIGKWISLIPFGIGYMTAFFRADRRALHDLLFDTAVVRGPSARNKT